MRAWWQDIRYAFRMLGRKPGIAAMAVLTLGLGMGGNTVIFSFFNAFFLRPLPFRAPNRLVDLDETAPRWNLGYTGLAYPDFHAWRQQNRSFTGMAAWARDNFNVSFQDNAERIHGARVTHDLLSVLGVQPAVGRPFTPEEDRPGGDKVVLLSYGLWQRLFGGQDVLGRSLQLNHQPFTIVGVLPRDKAMFVEAEVWVPLAENPTPPPGRWYLRGIGRLKAGVTLAAAREDLLRVHRGLVADHQANENTFPRLSSINERFFGDTRPVIMVLMGAVGLVLLIACGNVAALMLARGLARTREMSIRRSLGASSWHIGRLLGVEGLALSGLAGILGLFLGYEGLQALLRSLVDRPPGWICFAFDVRIWLYVLLMVLVTAAFGVLPAFYAVMTGSLAGAAQSSVRQSTASPARCRSLHLLVVTEVALTLILLVQAGLLVQAFRAIQKVDPGYRPEHVLVYQIALPDSRYATKEAKLAFFRSHLDEVRALPGVTTAGAVTAPPLGDHWGNFFFVEDAPAQGPDEQDPVVLQRLALPGYFEAMGITLVAGRSFNEQDGLTEGSLAAIVNETFARRYWPSQDPLGRRIRYRGDRTPWMTVVGVARDVKHYGLDRPMIPGVYVPYVQEPIAQLSVVVRTSSEPLSLMPAIRDVVRRHDPDLPIFGVATMADRLHQSLWLRRLYSSLIAVFAAVALLMALGGLYGVLSYVVGARTREIGVRMALGAHCRSVLWLVLRQALLLSVVGIALGLVGTVLAVPLIRGLLLGVHLADLMIFVAVPLFLLAVVVLASYLPARRAAKIDPMVALRCE
jgi:predicted permease